MLQGMLDFLTDPVNWSGTEGIGNRILQHVWYSFLSLGLAALVAFPVGVLIGHTRRGAFLAINLGNAARALPTLGLLTLVVLAVGLPFYWIMEPGRQENAVNDFNRKFRERGAHLFAPTDEGGFNCAFCHGGMEASGNVIEYNLPQPDGSVDVVNWRAPSLDTVLLRYSREEVLYILTYGRPGTPMPAWGTEGGGPLNDQQLQNLVDYLETIQLTPEEAQERAADLLDEAMAIEADDGAPLFGSEGEALFNLGLIAPLDAGGGSYSCARCHTSGWSYGELEPVSGEGVDGVYSRAEYEELLEISGCGGAFGPNLCDGATERQFADEADHIAFVTDGSEDGIGYGTTGQGDGMMPGFGLRPTEPALWWINGGAARDPGPGMLTPEMIEAIVDFERSL